MLEPFETVQLKSGESAEIGVLLAPDPADPLGVGELLAHKPGDWGWHLQTALADGLDRCETRFYLAVMDGRAVSNVMVSESYGVGILGHVFTRPEHRRKGLCQHVFDHLMPDFRSRGGLRLVLGTGFDSAPYWIYHRNGFRPRIPNSGHMTYESRDDYADVWYAPSPTTVASYDWRHWATLTQLLNDDFGQGLQALSLQAFGPVNFEGKGVSLRRACEDGQADFQVLETATGAAVGLALQRCDPVWPGLWNLDLVGHPEFSDGLSDLIAALPARDGLTQAWLPAVAAARRAALEAHGFVCDATLRGRLPNGGDLVVYRRG